jgi:hypothetical protein
MVRRRAAGRAARITFTRDFHALPTGDLRRGGPLQVGYDPLRIVPVDAPVRCGEPERPILLHARYRADGEVVTLPLRSPGGIVARPIGAADRRACLVAGTLAIPDDAVFVGLWFTYVHRDGSLRRDDGGGQTYRFRFPCQDLAVERTALIRLPGSGDDAFAVEVTSVPEVERLQLRYRLLEAGGRTAGDVDLVAIDDPSGRKRWNSPPQTVPNGAVIRFKLFYWIDGVRYKDDDGGNYYLAPDPDDLPIPPPPAALLDAAQRWSL